jgi:hypothetical protein
MAGSLQTEISVLVVIQPVQNVQVQLPTTASNVLPVFIISQEIHHASTQSQKIIM